MDEERPLRLSELEQSLLLLQIFRILGKLYDVNPQLMRDGLAECKLSLRERNNRVPTDRRYAQIASDEMVSAVYALTGTERELMQECVGAALLPSKLSNVLDVLRAHERDYHAMKRKDGIKKP